MSRLQELIDELCPNGVEYETLGEAAPFVRERANTGEAQFDAYVGVDSLLQNKAGRDLKQTDVPEGRHVYFKPGDTLLGNIRPYLRKVWFADCIGGTNGDVLVFRAKDSIDPKYLYYVISSEAFFIYDNGKAKGSKMPRGDKDAIKSYRFPVPPIEVQREIVRILDSFQELDDALTAEIEAREKQLLSAADELILKSVSEQDWKQINEIGELQRGKRFTFEQMSSTGDLGCIHYADVYFLPTAVGKTKTYLNSGEIKSPRLALPGDVVFSCTSEITETVGRAVAWIGRQPVAVHDDCQILHHSMDPIYISYFAQTRSFNTQKMRGVTRSKVSRLSGEWLGRVRIPVPALSRQHEIAESLALVEEVIRQLKAERDARRKQFEYYRDKLLSFPEMKA